MPFVRVGDSVCWYHAAETSRQPILGTCLLVHEKVVSMLCYSSNKGVYFRESVRHVTDPALKDNPHVRENGGWDFSDSHKELQRRLKMIEARLESRGGNKP